MFLLQFIIHPSRQLFPGNINIAVFLSATVTVSFYNGSSTQVTGYVSLDIENNVCCLLYNNYRITIIKEDGVENSLACIT